MTGLLTSIVITVGGVLSAIIGGVASRPRSLARMRDLNAVLAEFPPDTARHADLEAVLDAFVRNYRIASETVQRARLFYVDLGFQVLMTTALGVVVLFFDRVYESDDWPAVVFHVVTSIVFLVFCLRLGVLLGTLIRGKHRGESRVPGGLSALVRLVQGTSRKTLEGVPAESPVIALQQAPRRPRGQSIERRARSLRSRAR